MKKILHPLFRGYFAVRNFNWDKIYVDTGSSKFLSLTGENRMHWAFSVFFTYASDTPTEVVYTNEHDSVVFSKLYISQSFPYIRLSPNAKGVYKCFHFFFGRLTVTRNNEIAIDMPDATNASFKILDIVKIPQDSVLDDGADVFSRISALPRHHKTNDLSALAILDQSLNRLELQASTIKDRNQILKYKILLYAIFQVNHRVAFKALKSWVDTEKQAGRGASTDDFIAELAEITHPFALGRHGYYPSFANLDLNHVAKELHGIMKTVSDLGAVAFLNSGTLLGYVRQGKPLPHDDDFDLGIWVDGQSEVEIFENWRRFVNAVRTEYSITSKGSFLSVRMENGIQVDMFPAWTLANKTYIYPYCFADCDAAALLPFGDMQIEGFNFTVPAQPNELLSVNYGPNWRTPDPYWRFDFDKAQGRFKSVLKYLKVTY